VPGVDAATIAVASRREQLDPHVRIGLPPIDVVLRCLDKPSVLAAAESAGIPPPPSATCDGEEEALEAASGFGFPVVVKPIRSLADGRMQTTQWASNESALRALLPSFGRPFTVQRCETGAVHSLSGVVHDGELLALCASRDERMWPPRGGFTSASTTIEPPPETVLRLRALLSELGWQGIFQLELVETREGLATIDFNPRPYGSLALAIAAGANLPAVWVGALLGRTHPLVVARPGVRYRWEETEVLNFATAALHGRFAEAGRILVPRRGTTHAFFRASDPWPLAARCVGVARSRLRLRR
jgi:predicted ATP-grasp superfamily ATP-dependent carboligase